MDSNPTCWIHLSPREGCEGCSDAALAELRRRLSGDEDKAAPFVTPENRTAALRALDKAVKHARRMGLEVTCEAREVITTTL